MEIKYYSLYIAGIIIFVFAFLQSLLGFDLAWDVGSFSFTFFASMIAHANMAHLIGNLFSLILFGLLLEAAIGSDRFLKILFWAAVAGNLAAFGSYNSVLGISGGIYGLIGALSVLRPKMVLWLQGLPVPMVVAGIAYAFVDLLGPLAPVSNTGHLAHLAGFVVGIIAGFLYRKDVSPLRSEKPRLSRKEKRVIDKHLDAYEERYLKE